MNDKKRKQFPLKFKEIYTILNKKRTVPCHLALHFLEKEVFKNFLNKSMWKSFHFSKKKIKFLANYKQFYTFILKPLLRENVLKTFKNRVFCSFCKSPV